MDRLTRRLCVSGLLVAACTAFTYAAVSGKFSLLATIGAAAVCGVAIAIAAWTVRRRLGEPIDALQRTLDRFGEGELETPVPPRQYGDVRSLSRSLEAMRERLHRRLEAAESEGAQLRAVLADMVEGVVVLDTRGRIQVVNQRLRQLADVWGEADGRHYWEFFRHSALVEALRSALESDAVFVTEVTFGAKDGRVVQMHATGFGSSGTTIGTVAVFHDITELRRLERVRRDFVANVSHELKTPLTAIRGFAETLRVEEVPDDQRDRYLGIIERHAKRLTRLIEDLMALSRVEGGTEALNPEVVDIRRLVAGTLSDMSGQIEARKLEINEDHQGACLAYADRLAVEQILVNLIDNAAKYSDPGGRIEIRTRTGPNTIRISVADSGIGIPDGEHDRIFERFYRVDAARGRDVAGTGLGLAIVRHLLQLSGGEIAVESEHGTGSTFTVSLPTPPN